MTVILYQSNIYNLLVGHKHDLEIGPSPARSYEPDMRKSIFHCIYIFLGYEILNCKHVTEYIYITK